MSWCWTVVPVGVVPVWIVRVSIAVVLPVIANYRHDQREPFPKCPGPLTGNPFRAICFRALCPCPCRRLHQHNDSPPPFPLVATNSFRRNGTTTTTITTITTTTTTTTITTITTTSRCHHHRWLPENHRPYWTKTRHWPVDSKTNTKGYHDTALLPLIARRTKYCRGKWRLSCESKSNKSEGARTS
jgi:hypothetical protein